MKNLIYMLLTNNISLKHGKLCLLFLLFSVDLFAQRDLIVTQANEEIRCNILDESTTRFQYLYLSPSGKIIKNEIFKNLVKEFKYNAFESDLTEFQALKSGKRAKKSSDSKRELVNKTNDEKGSGSKIGDKDLHVKTNEKVGTKDDIKDHVYEHNSVIETPHDSTSNQKIELKKEKKPTKLSSKSEDVSKATTTKLDSLSTSPKLDQKITEDSQIEKSKSNPVSKNDKSTSVTVKNQDLGVTDKEELLNESKPDEKSIKQDVNNSIKPNEQQTTKITPIEQSFSKLWRIGMKAGIGNISDKNFKAKNNYDLYQEKLMKGYLFGADVAYFFSNSLGLGLVYTDFKSKNDSKGLNYVNLLTGAEVSGGLSNKIARKFIGPTLFIKKAIDNKTFGVLGLSPGMYYYSDKGDYNGALFHFKSKQFGGAATLGLDFVLGKDVESKDIIFSLEAGYNYGKINKLDLGNGQSPLILTNGIILDRLDFSIGLRFLRFPSYLRSKD